MLPIVDAIITPVQVNLPSTIRKPANGITASLGTGKTMLSRVIKINIPGYPDAPIIATAVAAIHSVIPIKLSAKFVKSLFFSVEVFNADGTIKGAIKFFSDLLPV